MSKNRAELKSYFVKNAIPTESQFAELIESSLSQVDDGVFKRGTDAVGVAAATGDEKRVLGLYATPTATGAEWTVCLNPKLTAGAAAGKPGFGISDGAGNSRLFISPTGQVGVGTNDPKAKLDVTGDIKASGAVYCGNADLYFSRTDHNHTGIGNTAGWAAIENGANFDALMILGRMSGTTRKVKMWDWVEVEGSFRVVGNAGVVDLEGANHAYIQWYPRGAAAGRKGWIGYGSSGTDTLSITNEAAGNLVQINGPLLASDTINAGGYGPRTAKVNAPSMEVGSPNPIPSGANGGLIYFHHHNVIAHQLRYNNGTLSLEAAGNGYGTNATPSLIVGGDVTVKGSIRSNGLSLHHDGNGGRSPNPWHSAVLGDNGVWSSAYNRLFLHRDDGTYKNEIHVYMADTTGPCSRKWKTEIIEVSEAERQDFLGQIMATPVVRYRLKNPPSKEDDVVHLGIIAEDAPPEIVNDEGALELGDYLAFLLAGIQVLKTELDTLRATAKLVG